MDEQKRIADYLDKKTPIIDETIERLRKEIDLLEELRTKIIVDVVTGQMDVRDVVIPEYSCDEDADSNDIEDDEEVIAESED